MKKILYLSRSGNFGGMEKHILDLINSVNKDFEVHIFCNSGEMAKEYENAFAIVRIVVPTSSIDISYMKKVKEYVVNNKIDIVHTHELEVSILGLLAVVDLKNVKKIMHIHTPITSWKHSLIGYLVKAPLNFIANFIVGNFVADKVVALTESIRQERVKRELISNSKIVLIPNAIDTGKFNVLQEQRQLFKNEILDKYQIPKDKIIIGNLSRLTREKGQDILLNAFAKLAKNSNYHLIIAGGGELFDEYTKLIDTLNIKDSCTLTGVFEEIEKLKLYFCFDYFVFPSRAEGFGYVLVEAMAVGLPILASDLQVLKDVSKGTIEFFQSENTGALIEKLPTFLSTKYDNQALKIKYDKVLINYTFTSFKNNYLSLYKSLF